METSRFITTRRVLLVGDDPDCAAFISYALANQAEVRMTPNLEEALTAVVSWKPDLIILYILISEGDSFAFLDTVKLLRGGEAYGMLCVIDGPRASVRMSWDGPSLFGVISRAHGHEVIHQQAVRALTSLA